MVFFFLFVDSTAFLNFPKITFVPWYSAINRVKKLWHLCESLSTCKLTRIVIEHHGFLFLFLDSKAFLNFLKIISVPWYSAIIRVKKTRTSVWRSLRHGRTIFRLMCLCVRPSTCAASWVAYTSKLYFFSFSSSNLSVSESWWQMSVSQTLLPAW